MKSRVYDDRRDAGRALVPEIQRHALSDPLILGLPRGGVPVAFEVAAAIDAPLDILIVRKIGAPFQPELALGAIASGDVRVLNDRLLQQLPGVDEFAIQAVVDREKVELARREMLYRGERPYPDLRNREIVLVDDGLATGATMRAATEAVRSAKPAKVLAAVPTGSAQAVKWVQEVANDVICLEIPSLFSAVGNYYRDFGQISDDEVRRLLQDAWETRPAS